MSPRTFCHKSNILGTVICRPQKGALLICFKINVRKGIITAKFQSLKCFLMEDAKGFMSPEKFQGVQEMGPWPLNENEARGDLVLIEISLLFLM